MTEAPRTQLTRPRLLAIGGAVSLVPLNSTMVAVALPRIARHFDISVGRTSILVTTYLVAMLVGHPVAGRIADRFGATRTLEVAMVGFAVASLAAASAPRFELLVAARIGQAAFGSALAPGVQAIVRTAAPPETRGRTLGLLGSMVGVGAASGPVLGGGLIALFGWRAIFLLNVPVIVVALFARLPMVRHGGGAPVKGLTPDALPLARNIPYVAAFGVQALSTVGQYMLLLVAPVVLDARGWSPASIGVALSGLTVGMIAMGPIGGHAGDRRGRRWPAVAGLLVCSVTLLAASLSGPAISPVPLIVVLTVFGFGLGFAVPSVQTAGLEVVEEQRVGAAAGVLSMSRYVGSIVTSVLVGAWLTSDGSGSRAALVVATVALVASTGLAWRLPVRVPLVGKAPVSTGQPLA